MQVLVIAATRWAAEGLAAALQRGSGHTDWTVRTLTLGELPINTSGAAEVAVLATDEPADALHGLPTTLPVLVLGAAALPNEPGSTRPLGWLPGETGDTRLAVAVQALAHGLSVFPADHAASPAALVSRSGQTTELRDPLTARELEVFELMAKGLGNRDIASALGISSHTAKFHVAQILDKTGSATRTEAVHQGLRLGLVGL